jgi:hypothetical protein
MTCATFKIFSSQGAAAEALRKFETQTEVAHNIETIFFACRDNKCWARSTAGTTNVEKKEKSDRGQNSLFVSKLRARFFRFRSQHWLSGTAQHWLSGQKKMRPGSTGHRVSILWATPV